MTSKRIVGSTWPPTSPGVPGTFTQKEYFHGNAFVFHDTSPHPSLQGRKPMKAYYEHLNTPIGVLRIEASDAGVTRVIFTGSTTVVTSAGQRGPIGADTLLPQEPPRGSDVGSAVILPPAAAVVPTESSPNEHTTTAREQLVEYFEGRRTQFTVPLCVEEGTAFQREVWGALTAVPHGRTQSYADIAAAVARPNAVRAVGAANGRNPTLVIVPCHRIIGSRGQMTGFSSGLDRKVWLLEHERKHRGEEKEEEEEEEEDERPQGKGVKRLKKACL